MGRLTRSRGIRAGALELQPQQRDLLGDRARLLLELTDLPRQVNGDDQQEHDGQEEHQADPAGHAQVARRAVQTAGEHRQDYDEESGEQPDERVLLPQTATTQELNDHPEDQYPEDDGRYR